MPENKYSLWNPHTYSVPARYIPDLNYVHLYYTDTQTKEVRMLRPEHFSKKKPANRFKNECEHISLSLLDPGILRNSRKSLHIYMAGVLEGDNKVQINRFQHMRPSCKVVLHVGHVCGNLFIDLISL